MRRRIWGYGVKNVSKLLAIVLVLSLGGVAVEAKKKVASNYLPHPKLDGVGTFSSKAVDPSMAFVMWQVSHHPELMHVEYLKHYLGKPEIMQVGEKAYACFWYDHVRQARCELHQEEDKTGQHFQSRMIFHFPGNQLSIDEFNDVYGGGYKRFFDYNGHPNELYSFAPNTSLAVTSPLNCFAVKKATVTYLGPVLAHPADEHFQHAKAHYRAKVQAHHDNGNWSEMLLHAQERVHDHPNDPEAHALLAKALMKTGSVHESIGEYKYALTLNQQLHDPNVNALCIAGLQDLHVVPKDYKENQAPDKNEMIAAKSRLHFHHSGQRLRVAGEEDPAQQAPQAAVQVAGKNSTASQKQVY